MNVSHLIALVGKGDVEIASLGKSPEGLELQQLLAKAGYMKASEVDGIFGRQSAQAFKDFKGAVFLAKPNILGKGSLAKLIQEAEEADRKAQKLDTAQPEKSGATMKLPTGLRVYLDDPIVPGGHFTWAEATHSGSRVPVSREIEGNIVKLAKALETPRVKLGRSMTITSWYRTPQANRACGGARASRHLVGDAGDILVSGFSGVSLARSVFSGWHGGLGIYTQFPNLLHVDVRGCKARWNGAPW